jgi:hypothetical protein
LLLSFSRLSFLGIKFEINPLGLRYGPPPPPLPHHITQSDDDMQSRKLSTDSQPPVSSKLVPFIDNETSNTNEEEAAPLQSKHHHHYRTTSTHLVDGIDVSIKAATQSDSTTESDVAMITTVSADANDDTKVTTSSVHLPDGFDVTSAPCWAERVGIAKSIRAQGDMPPPTSFAEIGEQRGITRTTTSSTSSIASALSSLTAGTTSTSASAPQHQSAVSFSDEIEVKDTETSISSVKSDGFLHVPMLTKEATTPQQLHHEINMVAAFNDSEILQQSSDVDDDDDDDDDYVPRASPGERKYGQFLEFSYLR